MRVVEQRATPGPPRMTYREDPICGMVLGVGEGHCQELATVGVYHRSTGGRSDEIIYWCPDHADLFDTETENPATLHGDGVGIVPSGFNGWFEG